MPCRGFVGAIAAVAVVTLVGLTGCGPVPEGPPAPTPELAPHHGRHHPGSRTPEAERPDRSTGDRTEVPAQVGTTLRFVDEHHRAPDGYEGGREFHNAEHALPARDAAGRPITYREWDVNPKREGVNRGAERLITGSDGSAWYTADHYRTFRKVR